MEFPVHLTRDLGVLFFLSLFLSRVLTPLAFHLSLRIGALDVPDGRKIHDRVVPRLGGIAMASALILSLAWLVPFSKDLQLFLAGACLIALVGFLDDVFVIRPGWKFLGQALAVSIFVFSGGGMLCSLGDLFCTGPIVTGTFAPWVTIFCAVGVINALNLSDGLDGLAAGISAIACVFLGIFAYLQADWLALAILAVLFGGILGFLRFNTFPAILFMGDTGSMLLGYTLATMAIRMVRPGVEGGQSPVTIAAVLALPIMDTLLVMFRRIRNGENPFHPDKTHLHHRLMRLGLSHGTVVSIIYVCMAAFGFLAWGARSLPEWWQLTLVLLLGALIHGGMYALRNARDRRVTLPGASSDRWNPAAKERIAGWMEKSVPLVLWCIAIGMFPPSLMMGNVSASEGMFALAAAGFVAALFPWFSHRTKTGVCYGLIYAASVCAIGILHRLEGSSVGIWMYMAIFSGSVLVWVLVRLKVRERHRDAVRSSGFETLLLGVSLFVGFVAAPALVPGRGLRGAILLSCIESIPLILALKLIGRTNLRRVAGSLLVVLLLLGARGLLGDVDLFNAFAPSDSHATGLR